MGLDSILGIVAMLALGAVQSVGVPVLWIVAAGMLWNAVPRWISVAFLVSGVAGIVIAIPGCGRITTSHRCLVSPNYRTSSRR